MLDMSTDLIRKFVPFVPKTRVKKAKRKFKVACRTGPLPVRDNLPTGNMVAVLSFHLPPRIQGEAFMQSADIDNLLKQSLDVVKGSLIRDDVQIKELHARIVESSDKVGFYVTLQPIGSCDQPIGTEECAQ